MGLGKLFNRSTVYQATNTVTNETQTFTIVDNLAPDWATSSYRGGMAIPGAWRAANLISGIIGQLPWDCYRELPGKPVEKLARPPLLEQPNPPNTRMTTFSAWALDLLWDGNAIGVVAARNAAGWPTAVVPVPACNVGVRRVTDTYSPLPVGSLEYKIGNLAYGAEDIIHVKGPSSPGALRGEGILEAHLNALNLANELGRQARSISRHGVPTGVLKVQNPDATDAEIATLKAGWLAAQRDRTVAVLNPVLDFQPLAWNPEELQLVDARKFSLTELELIFGLPVGFLGGQTSSRTYSNIEQDAINLVKFSLADHLARFEQTLSLAFPRGTIVRANLDALLRSDTESRYAAHAIALDKGFLTVDEVRDLENRPPLRIPVEAPAPAQEEAPTTEETNDE